MLVAAVTGAVAATALPSVSLPLTLPGATTSPPVGAASQSRIADRLDAISGMRVRSEIELDHGWFLRLSYRQPADHRNPDGQAFRQRFTLLHVGVRRPMVLYTSGYNVSDKPFITEPTELLGANQISTEQRFFRPSRPKPPDWDLLTIRQAAADHHRLIKALRPIYCDRWISTGGSKGGMVSVYHRRFYPRDVAGTVAYVAPNDVVNSDDVYTDFVATAGPRSACNRRLRRFQVEALQRRDRLVPALEHLASQRGLTIESTLGSWDRAFEAAVLDTPFAFWQYFDATLCPAVPRPAATDQKFMNFVDMVESWSFYSDEGLRPYAAYFRHAASQLGWPNVAEAPHLAGLLHYRQAGSAPASTPRAIRPRHFHRGAMADIDRWVRKHGKRLLFIYGEDDPWSAEPFRLGTGTRGSAVFWEHRGNHGARIAGLDADDRRRARRMVRRWADTPRSAVDRVFPGGLPTEAELRLRRTYGL